MSRADHDALESQLAQSEQERDDARREASSLRIELKREIRNGEQLTALCARAVESVQIYRQALIERQIGAKRDPALVLVVNNLPEIPKRRFGFIPLNKRRRQAAKKDEAAQLRRNALPTLTAQLPEIPLTPADAHAITGALAAQENN